MVTEELYSIFQSFDDCNRNCSQLNEEAREEEKKEDVERQEEKKEEEKHVVDSKQERIRE